MLKGPEMIGSLNTAFRKIRQRVGRVDKRARLFDEAEWELYERVREFTMTSPERVCALAKAVEYVARNDIEGAIVACGVWRGGSMMAVAYSLLAIGCTRYDLYLFDTFSGMVQPSRKDGDAASEKWKRKANDKEGWCFASLDDVRANLAATGYPSSRIHFVEGRVEDTIPHRAPGAISLLRLDTDWYESTKHDLEYLYPRLTRGACWSLMTMEAGPAAARPWTNSLRSRASRCCSIELTVAAESQSNPTVTRQLRCAQNSPPVPTEAARNANPDGFTRMDGRLLYDERRGLSRRTGRT